MNNKEQYGKDRMAKTALENKILLGIIMFLMFIGMLSYPVNVEAASSVKMNPGQSQTMKLPKGWINVKWSSNKKAVAKINQKGTVKAVASGKAVITAKAGKRVRKYTVRVQKIRLSSNEIIMNAGDAKKITVKNALGKIAWSSNGKSVRVNSKGKITAVRAGKAVVTASVFGRKYSCIVTVKEDVKDKKPETYKIRIKAGEKQFSATLYNNKTTQAFIKRLPLTINMNELNGNEKYYYFSKNLPADSRKPKKIYTGDIMLYGSDCLVLFYDDFSTSYSYTPIGRITNPDGLAKALDGDKVRVSFYRE